METVKESIALTPKCHFTLNEKQTFKTSPFSAARVFGEAFPRLHVSVALAGYCDLLKARSVNLGYLKTARELAAGS